MKNYLFLYLLFGVATAFYPLSALSAQVMLANQYAGENIAGWLASEKLDGIRGYWDGKKLYSRNGKLLPMPPGWADNFPPFPLDGELFIARGDFDRTSGKIRRGDWDGVKLYVFDLPKASGTLPQRLAVLKQWLKTHLTDHLIVIEQIPITDIHHVQRLLAEIEEKGGEGLILREPKAPYLAGRSSKMLKLKSRHDDECTVIAHHTGQGKYSHLLGSLSCRLTNGDVIRIGSGFSDAERANPPPIGSIITFRYRGMTSTGKPRFATFWRIRRDADLSQ